jgi:LAS superfamily LD-carboxypeptidase LdcB
MMKISFKKMLPAIILIIFCIPIATSSLLDLEQKKANELILEQEKIQKEIAEKTAQKNYLLGKFDQRERDDFSLIPSQDTTNKTVMYLRKETLAAFLEMQNAADLDEISLKIASATRNFDYQKNIWNDKWTGATLVDGKNLAKSIPDELLRFKKILEYSAVPGTSRHHWGTDIDINDANPPYFETEKGEKEYTWLVKNAWKFGFCQPYDLKDNDRPTGYNEEKWHWSYLPLATNFTEEYKNLITDADIAGFEGDQYVAGQNLIDNHVLGINPDCF